MGVLLGCQPRDEVLRGDLQDSIFAADFGELIQGTAHEVYRDPETFFRNTHPATQLQSIVKAVFGHLGDPAQGGALLRLSTGFGGGKTHTLMALWHLAKSIQNPSLGHELLPEPGRPKNVTVVAIDASKAGRPVFQLHDDAETHSLAGELVYQLGGAAALTALGQADHEEASPADRALDRVLPDGPLLILLDELVVYQAKLGERGQRNLLGFLAMLLRKVANRPQTVMVVTDPGKQPLYAAESAQLGAALDREATAAKELDELFDRTTSEFDPIGREGPQVISRRLFQSVDRHQAEATAATYHSLYARVTEEHPGLLPAEAAHPSYTDTIARCYPFHPRLFRTIEDRLGAIQDFQQSRGMLRLFARVIRDVWERRQDLELITAGDLDWSSSRIQGDLLDRIERGNFRAAVSADIEGHAAELDGGPTGIHRRVASALLLESLPLAPHSGLDEAELTLAVLRPEEAGPEPAEALGRLTRACWHTYPLADGRGWQFRYEPNVNKQIEERMEQVPREDAKSAVLAEVQSYFAGPAFKVANWPDSPRQVADTTQFQVALCETEQLARDVCGFVDDHQTPRRFKNALVAIAANPAGLRDAIERAQRHLAAVAIDKESKSGDVHKPTRDQLLNVLPSVQRQFRLAARRAFDRVVTATAAYGVEERYLAPDDPNVSFTNNGQAQLRKFLDDKQLIYQDSDALDIDLFLEQILPGATPLAEQPDVTTAKAVYERFLSAPGLRLVLNSEIVRRTLLNAVKAGRLVVRLADGRAYDAAGCVQGPEGQRRRVDAALTAVAMDSSVWVARAEHASAKLWLHEDPIIDPNVDPPPPPPPPSPGPVTTYDLDDALRLADQRPLQRLRLTATTPAAAEHLVMLAQPFSADRLTLSVTVDGDVREGGGLGFSVHDVHHTHAIEPLALAAKLHRALAEGAQFEASVELHFGETNQAAVAARLSDLGPNLSETVSLEATFGPPAKSPA